MRLRQMEQSIWLHFVKNVRYLQWTISYHQAGAKENWNLQDIYSDEGKSGTSLRKRDAFKRMMRDAKDQKMDLPEKMQERQWRK